MLSAVVNAFRIPDLRRKILFTISMLILFRLVNHIPVPGVNPAEISKFLNQSSGGGPNSLFNILDLFSGGGLTSLSIAAMGVYPYITASIIMQLLNPIIPALAELSKQGEAGRNKINRYTHWLTVPLAGLQAYGQTAALYYGQGRGSVGGIRFLNEFGFTGTDANPIQTATIIISMIAGTMFLVWLGELITEHGIGNGMSIIIFSGIVARLPTLLGSLVTASQTRTVTALAIIAFILIGLGTVIGIVLMNQGQREIRVVQSKFTRGRKMYGGGETYLPLKVNSAGMIPLIFAVSLMLFPTQVATFFINSKPQVIADAANWTINFFNPTTPAYNLLYFLMVVGFTYFYTVIIYQQQNIAENLKNNHQMVPGRRPGIDTNNYLMRVLNRITMAGALFLGLVAVLPALASWATGVNQNLISGTALLIVIGVAIDTMKQLEAQLKMRNYEGFIK